MFFENIICWFVGAWDNVTGMNAPLYGRRFGEKDKRWNVVGYDQRSKSNDLVCCLEWFDLLLVEQRLSSE